MEKKHAHIFRITILVNAEYPAKKPIVSFLCDCGARLSVDEVLSIVNHFANLNKTKIMNILEDEPSKGIEIFKVSYENLGKQEDEKIMFRAHFIYIGKRGYKDFSLNKEFVESGEHVFMIADQCLKWVQKNGR